jgi:hypothetical protein
MSRDVEEYDGRLGYDVKDLCKLRREMMGKVSVVLAIAVLLSGLPDFVLAGDAPPTNLELVEQAVREAVYSIDSAPPPGRNDDLGINIGGRDDASWLLSNALKDHFLDLGWRIRSKSETADSNAQWQTAFVLKVRVIDLGLRYTRTWRRYLLGGKLVERVARVSLYYELVDRAADQVVTSSTAKAEVRDIVPASLLQALSDSKHGFADPELEKSKWDRYLEGGLVLAIVGVLVYLFYSNKTAAS